MSCDPVLNLLNEQVNNLGQLQQDCDLLFFTPALCYKAKMCPCRGLELFVYDRFKPDLGWTYVSEGTLMQLATTLNQDGPFLTPSNIPTFWPVIPG